MKDWPKLKKIENNLKFSDIDFYMSKYHFFNIFPFPSGNSGID